jgi:hypothetical protein
VFLKPVCCLYEFPWKDTHLIACTVCDTLYGVTINVHQLHLQNKWLKLCLNYSYSCTYDRQNLASVNRLNIYILLTDMHDLLHSGMMQQIKYIISMEKVGRSRPLGRPRHRWENNIKVDFR